MKIRKLFAHAIIGTVLLAAMSSPSLAVLAPHYQRANELGAVISAATDALQPRPITKVIHQNDDQYLVTAGNCSVKASLITLPIKSGFVGPRQFKVQLGKVLCKK